MKKGDRWIPAILVIITALLSVWWIDWAITARAEHRKYQECVQDIAPYLKEQS